MIPPPLTSRALTRSEAQYSAHAATSSVRGSRSLKLSCPQRRMAAYQGAAVAARARSRRPGTAATPAAAEQTRNFRRFMGSNCPSGQCPAEPRLQPGTTRAAPLVATSPLVHPYPPLHRRDQLAGIVPDAVLEDERHVPDDRRLRGQVPAQHHEIGELAALDRSQALVDAEDRRAIPGHDAHRLRRREARRDEQLVVTLITEPGQRAADPGRV